MGALGLCLVLLAASADAPTAQAEEEQAKKKAFNEPEFIINLGAKLEALIGTELIGAVDQYSVTANYILEPGVLVQERSGSGQVTMTYVPWLLWTPAVPNHKLVFHRILVDAEQALNHTMGLTVVWRFWLGDQSFSPVVNLGTAPGPGQPPGTIPQVPQVTTLPLLDTSVRFGYWVQTSAVFRLDTDIGYLYSEGTTAAARLQLPLQRGPFLDLVGTQQLQTHDALITRLRSGWLSYGPVYRPSGSNNENGSTVLLPHFNVGLNIWGTELGLKWQHALSANLSTELGGGIGIAYQSSSYDIPTLNDQDLLWLHRTPVPATTSAYPLLLASIRDQVPIVNQTLVFNAAAALLPIINQFSGTVVQRLDVSASMVWGVGSFWVLVASAGVAGSLDPKQIDARAELRGTLQVGSHVVVSAGARLAYLDYSTPGALNGTSWVLFLSVAGATGKLGATAGASSSSGAQGFLQ